jgi:glycosyltransferase involved in cell wall biosynthesis
MSQSCDVTVVTQAKNQPRIERWHREHSEQKSVIRYSYLELGPIMRWIKKKMPGGMYLYYVIWQWRLRSHVTKLLGEHPFDLIHHVTFASFRMPVFAAGRPIVWGPVGGAETAPMHLLEGHGTLAGRMRERYRNLSTWMAGHFVKTWEPSQRTGGIALASTPATAEILQRNGINTVMMPTIGYDADHLLSTTKKNASKKALRLLFVGRMHLLKGIHLLLEALANLDQRQVTLTIVGDGQERVRLAKLAVELGLEQRVTFRGFVSRTSLTKVFDEHDVMVAPSLYESGGLSVLEGFAHGLPAIVLDCGGHALSVSKTCGFKIPSNLTKEEVVREIAKAISTYTDDPDLLQRHVQQARVRLDKAYSWPKKHDAMLAIYQKLAQRNSEVLDKQDHPSLPFLSN